MAGPFHDCVMETAASPGIGPVHLTGVVAGFRPWSDVGDGNPGYYRIFAVDTNGNPSGLFETGSGVYNVAGNILTRTTVYGNSSGTTATINFTGAVRVMQTPIAKWCNDIDSAVPPNPVTPARGGTGLNTLTPHAVMLGEGTSNVGFAVPGTPGRIMVDQGASADPGFKTVSGDATLASSGALALANTTVTPGAYKRSDITVDAKGRITAAATGLTQMSITEDAFGLKLVNDAASPGNSFYYGTDANGNLGWYPQVILSTEDQWNYSATNTMVDPGVGRFRTDATAWASVTNIAINIRSSTGVDRTAYLAAIQIGDEVQINTTVASSNWAHFKVTALPTNNSTWFLIPVVIMNLGGSTPTNNTGCLVTFAGTGIGGAGDFVASFNTRTGAVTLTALDVTNALGDTHIAFTDVVQTFTAKQTFTGGITSQFQASGTLNEVFGANAGNIASTGSFNVFVGNSAGASITTASNNTFVGYLAGQGHATGGDNVCIGLQTKVADGQNASTAVGTQANCTGGSAVAVGQGSTAATSGVAVGSTAVVSGTIGVAVGSGANAAQSRSCALGHNAITQQQGDMVWGDDSATPMRMITQTRSTAALRYLAGLSGAFVVNTDATFTTQGKLLCFDFNSPVTGREVMRWESNGTTPLLSFYGVPAVARQSGEIVTGLVSLGLFSGITGGAIAYTGTANTFTALNTFTGGLTSPGPVTGGTTNEIIGAGAGNLGVATGNSNVIIGNGAAPLVTTAFQQVIIGYQAAPLIQTGNANVIIGFQAKAGDATNQNVVIGTSANANANSTCTVIGSTANVANTSSTAIGSAATCSAGSVNIALGVGANAAVSRSCAIGRGTTTFQVGDLTWGDDSNASGRFIVQAKTTGTGGTFQYIAGIAGSYVDRNNGTFRTRAQLLAFDLASNVAGRTGVSVASSGSAPMLQFFGTGSEVTQPSGDIAAGLVALGLFSSVTSSLVYTSVANTFTAAQTFSAGIAAPTGAGAASEAYGAGAGNSAATSAAVNNTLLGAGAGNSITSASNLTLIGRGAGAAITSGGANTIVGALSNITGGGNNTTIVGYNITVATAGSNTVVIGVSSTADSNGGVAIGASNTNHAQGNILGHGCTVNTGADNSTALGGDHVVGASHQNCLVFGEGLGVTGTLQSSHMSHMGRATTPLWTAAANTSAANNNFIGGFKFSFPNSTTASFTTRIVAGAYDFNSPTTLREAIRWEADGAAARLSFFGAAAIAQPSGDVATGLVALGLFSSATVSGGSALSRNINQTTHGFVVGNWLRLSGTSTYASAKADVAANADVVGVVTAVIDANNFTLTTGGYITGLSGLTANTTYFLSPITAGALVATAPSSTGQIDKPLLIADTTTSGYFFNFRGMVVPFPVAGTTNQITVTAGVVAIANNPILPGTTRSDSHYGTLFTDTDGPTITFDMAVSNLHQVVMGGNRTLAVTNVQPGQTFILRLIQDGTGTRVPAWFGTLKWSGGTAPTLTTTAGKTDVFSFLCTSAGNFDAFIVGLNL